MNREQIRSLISQAVIASGVCGALYVFGVRPFHIRSAMAQAQLESNIAATSNANQILDDLPKVVGMLHSVESQSEVIRNSGSLAGDQSAVFSKIMTLASDADIIVDQIIPAPNVSSPNSAIESAIATATPLPNDLHSQYSLTGTGTYVQIVDFLARIQRSCGYCIIRSCHIASQYAMGNDTVSYSITLDLYAFDTAPVSVTSPEDGSAP